MPLRCAWAVHPSHCLCAGETLPMWKPTTGEPYAGEPHVRFGGRGGATPLPDPYRVDGNISGREAEHGGGSRSDTAYPVVEAVSYTHLTLPTKA